MKTAIVHDWLMGLGGAERVLEEILALFPSPVFTLFQNKHFSLPSPIRHSFLQHFPLISKYYRSCLPLYPLAIKQFDLSDFDLIISSSHAVAKGIRTAPNQLHICYCHTPMRYIWDLEQEYLSSLSPLTSPLAKLLFKSLRKWDLATATHVDAFIANSHFIADRIHRLYNRHSTVIYPPVATHLFQPASTKENFYLSISRLVPYKKIDLLVEAFNQTPHRTLKIVGDGPLRKTLQGKARPNIEFLGFQSDAAIQQLLPQAKAFIFAAEDDFGIAPVEAQAAGTPVIAYGKGGALETILPEKTGLFFSSQSTPQLLSVLSQFEALTWDPIFISAHSQQFSTARFRKEFTQFVTQQWEVFCENRHSCRR